MTVLMKTSKDGGGWVVCQCENSAVLTRVSRPPSVFYMHSGRQGDRDEKGPETLRQL